MLAWPDPRVPEATRRDNVPFPNIHIDYSHRGVGPYGPEAYSQIPTSDDYLYMDTTYPEAISAWFLKWPPARTPMESGLGEKGELSGEVCLDPIHFAFLDHPTLKWPSKIPTPKHPFHQEIRHQYAIHNMVFGN